jgi:hypothetical protein
MSVKIKSVIPKSQKEDVREINEMFEQIVGTADAEEAILIPKIVCIYNALLEYSHILYLFSNTKGFFDKSDECKTHLEQIKKYALAIASTHKFAEIETNGTVRFGKSISELDEKFADKSRQEVNQMYRDLKEHKDVQSCITFGAKNAQYKKFLMDEKGISDSFIKKEIGVSLQPFHFSGFDVKQLWLNDCLSSPEKQFILTVLSKCLVRSVKIYSTITSPDVDIKKYSHILVDAIKNLKKQIPGCDDAFRMISQSVNLLENNFDSYYKDSIIAENPSMIMENFVIDISRKHQASPKALMQFNKIVGFMRQNFAKNKDPKVQALLNKLGKQMSALGVPETKGD